MTREEDIGMNRVHLKSGVRWNHPILNALKRELYGWSNLEDALIDKPRSEKNESNEWIHNTTWPEDSQKVNSKNYRCDEFKSQHDGEHILFSGCSVTYGVGLYTNELWSYKLYEKIKGVKKVSGYYNLGTPGSSVLSIVSNIFKYIYLYGKPDSIFLDLPDLNRFYVIPPDEKMVEELIDHGDIRELHNELPNLMRYGTYIGMPNRDILVTRMQSYEYLSMLEQYCSDTGIKLYIFSYVQDTLDFLSQTDLPRVFDVDNGNLINELYEYSQQNKVDKYFLVARDERHHGTAFHNAWANRMFDFYQKEDV